jgi:hypothetical protein
MGETQAFESMLLVKIFTTAISFGVQIESAGWVVFGAGHRTAVKYVRCFSVNRSTRVERTSSCKIQALLLKGPFTSRRARYSIVDPRSSLSWQETLTGYVTEAREGERMGEELENDVSAAMVKIASFVDVTHATGLRLPVR